MSRRVRILTRAEIAAQLAEDSSDDSIDGEVFDREADDEEDQVHVFDNDERDTTTDNAEHPDDDAGPARHIEPGAITRSQAILNQADLHLVPQRDAGPYRVRGARGAEATIWETTPPPPTRRRSQANIIRETAGVHGREAQAAEDGVTAFRLFLTDEMVAEILRRTNEKLQQEREHHATLYSPEVAAKVEHRVADLTESELWAFLGLCLLRGFYPVPVLDLFNPARGPAMFAATMSRSRFETILRHLSFDDRQTRAARRTGDAFCHLRWFVDAFNDALRRNFRPSETVTLDESLVRFRGRCAFRVFMKSKPGKYGILLRTLADANHRYMLKVWPYSGGYPQEPERGPPHVHFGSVPEMVNFMVEELMGSGRNVTMDRFFTSTEVADNLLSSRLTIVGTIDRRRRMPEELKDPRGREEGTNLFAFNGEKTLVSFCPKKGKVVTALSTQHHEPLADAKTKKPEIILFYNATKGGVDVLDAMVEKYLHKPPLCRWPTTVFIYLLGIAQINASTVLMMNRGISAGEVKKSVRRELIYSIGESLARQRVQERALAPRGLNRISLSAIQCAMEGNARGEEGGDAAGDNPRRQSRRPVEGDARRGGQPTEEQAGASGEPDAPPGVAQQPVHGRCHMCLAAIKGDGYKVKKGKLSRNSTPCDTCRLYVCSRHSTKVCQECG